MNDPIQKATRLLLIALGTASAGCSWGGSRTRILAPQQAPTKTSTMSIVEGDHTANVPEKERAEFRKRLERKLYARRAFTRGSGMTVEYRIVLYDKGSQLQRYWLGYGAGEGEMIVEATFRSGGREAAKIETSGRLSMGSFGGSFRDTYNRVIKEIVAYATSNFASG